MLFSPIPGVMMLRNLPNMVSKMESLTNVALDGSNFGDAVRKQGGTGDTMHGLIPTALIRRILWS